MTPALRRFRLLSIVSLVMLVIVVVAGAVVRLTDSGLGCADWPNCSDERFVDVTSTHAAIEQINRIYSGLVGVMALVVFVAAVRLSPRRSDLVKWSGLALVGVIANAILGGISVRINLHPLAVQGHLLLALLCVAATTVLVRQAAVGPITERGVSKQAMRLVTGVAILTGLSLLTGTVVTGAGPHAGDENAPRLDVAITTVVPIHSLTVIATLIAIVSLAWHFRSNPDDRRALANITSTWMFIGLLQAAVGYIQYFNSVPPLLVGIHVTGATVLTWVTTLLVLDTRVPREPSSANPQLGEVLTQR